MNQDSLDKKFKDILGKLDEQDTLEAMSRKESVWRKVSEDKKGKKRNYLWLLLLFGCALFFAS